MSEAFETENAESVEYTVVDEDSFDPTEASAFGLHTPAWEGHEVTNANLVLEGGAMRGMFTAGVLDYFCDKGLFCENIIGVSAGALCGLNYVAGEDGRTAFLNMLYCDDPRYLSLYSFATTGNAMGLDFMFDEIPNKLHPLNFDAFNASPMNLTVVSSNLELGEADYHRIENLRFDMDYVVASASMPVVSQITDIDGKLLLDGGTCDSIPINYSLLTGAKKHIVILTQDETYEKKPNSLMPIIHREYADYPYYIDRCEFRHYEYNRTTRMLKRMHEAGDCFVIQPQKPVEISNMEKDRDKLFDLYQQGLEVAAKTWDDLQEYLAK